RTNSRYPELDDASAWEVIQDRFYEKRAIPGIIGATNGTHIPILKPPNDPWNAYINRKGWASLAFQ
ncbi:hypothetical protein BDK51DRAFT_3540, partial [Blyttiomyces helicus]